MLTVLCPVLNEADYIETLLQFFVTAPPAEKELLIIDGGSTDATVQIVNRWAAQYPQVRVLHNEHKTVPFALNIGVRASTGTPVVRLDAHTEYAPDYFEKILETFERTGADIVGGPMRCTSKTPVQEAIAYCTSTTFGVGGSTFHRDDFEGWTDSVYLGAWRRSIFVEIGYFDESLVRNQDDEFHYRAIARGKRIYLNPAIRSFYFPRDTFPKLFRQYFQYGFYKPLVFKKLSSSIRVRHVIPAAFVLYALSLPLAFACPVWLLPLCTYFGINAYFSLRANMRWRARFNALLTYPILHISYGSGFLLGLWHWNIGTHES